MKTLKQQLQELEHLNTAIQKSNYYTEEEAHEEIIQTIKEWLEQKRQEKNIHYDSLDRLQSPHANDRARNTTNHLLDELLEELTEA